MSARDAARLAARIDAVVDGYPDHARVTFAGSAAELRAIANALLRIGDAGRLPPITVGNSAVEGGAGFQRAG
ncbi:MAG: hypothetical protein R3E98_02605 [Gemmatimonadota bacterium]|nr:hypothetical protein [Gemmatimonadota bacterium]